MSVKGHLTVLPNLAAWLLLAAVSGCGVAHPPATVTGTVTYKSKEIEKGTIRFTPARETPGVGGVGEIRNGKYRIDTNDLLAGPHIVRITGLQETGKTTLVEVNDAGVRSEIPEVIQYIPEKFNNSSTLESELDGGENTKDFSLEG